MHTRKKILVFADWFLPGFKAGGPIRSVANLVHSLEIDFWIVTRITDHQTDEPYAGITPGVWTAHRPNVQVCYLHERDVNSNFLEKIFSEQSFDHLYFNSLFSPAFTLQPLRLARKKGLISRCVLAPRGMLKPGALSVKARKKRIFLFTAKMLGLFNGIRWHATNEEEAQEIKTHFGNSCVVCVAPNLATAVHSVPNAAQKLPGELRLVCIARISSEKGIREALQFLKAAHLERVECTFYGVRQNKEYLEECMALAQQIDGAVISFPGEITPEAIPAALNDAHFFYLPTWGENFGHAIAEALQYGKPVIVSNRTPWINLQSLQAGWDLPLEATAFVDVLNHCLQMGQEEYTRMSIAARDYGLSHTQDPAHLRAYYSLFA